MSVGVGRMTICRGNRERSSSRGRRHRWGGLLSHRLARAVAVRNADEQEPASAALGESRDRPVVVYCLSGHRSTVAMRRLRELGFQDVSDGGSMESLRLLISKTQPTNPCALFR